MRCKLVAQADNPVFWRNKHKSRGRGYLKRCAARAMRRVAKLLREDAPVKPRYRGWYS